MDISSVLLVIPIVAAALVGRMGISARLKTPWLTGAACVLLAICLVAQLDMPGLLPLLERDASAIRAGQPYRLFTALWFQDGGVAGGMFNIAMLAMLGFFAEQSLIKVGWLGVYFVGGLMSEVVALSWQPVGAGNSVAYMCLAGALLGLGFRHPTSRAIQIVTALGLGAGLLLCAHRDIHGAAVWIGCVLGVLVRSIDIHSGSRTPV